MTRSPPVSVDKPALLVDIDGVISIHGWPPGEAPAGRWLTVDGIVHFISASAAGHLQELARSFELWWCSGWEEKANEHLLGPLGLAGPLPYVGFDVAPRRGGAHWKLAAIDSALGAERPWPGSMITSTTPAPTGRGRGGGRPCWWRRSPSAAWSRPMGNGSWPGRPSSSRELRREGSRGRCARRPATRGRASAGRGVRVGVISCERRPAPLRPGPALSAVQARRSSGSHSFRTGTRSGQ